MVCTMCGNDYPLTAEYYAKSKGNKLGFKTRCKKCDKEYLKLYYYANKERAKVAGKLRYENNKEYISNRQKEYVSRNRESILEKKRVYNKARYSEIAPQKKLYRDARKEKNSAYFKIYRENNREKLSAYKKKYWEENKVWLNRKKRLDRINNPSRYLEYYLRIDKVKKKLLNDKYRGSERGKLVKGLANAKRRSFKKNGLVLFTKAEWLNCLELFNNSCAYCGIEGVTLSKDHFVALSSGGEYTKNNIVCSCLKCNSSKQNSSFFDWYPKQKFYSESRKIKILKYLNYNSKNKSQQLALLGVISLCQ